MDVYKDTLRYLLEIPTVSTWEDIPHLLQKMAVQRPYDWRLPLLAAEAVGAPAEQALPAAAAVACLQISIILVDDLLDEEPQGEHRRRGAPAVANLALAFQAAGLEAIARGDAPLPVQWAVLRRINQMAFVTAWGQHLDVETPQDEDAYWHLVRTKSTPFFEAALYAGAMLGGATLQTASQIARFGHLYGELIQIQDDMHDTMATPADPDWVLGRAPLPILYAEVVAHPQRARFKQLRQALPDPDALAEAQTILLRSGAISYCVDQFLQRYRRAQTLLAGLSVPAPEPLAQMLSPLLAPIQDLFAQVGVQEPLLPWPEGYGS